MPETVTLLEDEGIILVTSTGVVTKADLDGSIAEIRRQREENDIHQVLVDARTATAFPEEMSMYEFGRGLKDDKGMTVAMIPSRQADHSMRFLSTVARTWGAELHVFESVEEGMAWLKRTAF